MEILPLLEEVKRWKPDSRVISSPEMFHKLWATLMWDGYKNSGVTPCEELYSLLRLSISHHCIPSLCLSTLPDKRKNSFTAMRFHFFHVFYFFLSANPSKQMCCNCFSRSGARTVQLNVLSFFLLLFLRFLQSMCHSPSLEFPVGSPGLHKLLSAAF